MKDQRECPVIICVNESCEMRLGLFTMLTHAGTVEKMSKVVGLNDSKLLYSSLLSNWPSIM